jgi:hypothetical protein
MIGHCKDCHHWYAASFKAAGWDCFPPEQKVGLCGIATPKSGETYGPLMAAVDLGEGIYSDLVTDERFGCVLFAERAPA